ncbi:MAG: penicillin-binding protein 2 [Acidimicrobiales bacterium]|nr:penicillin-binding protein 2 [Acidimicrobiales bacterium]
MNERIRRLGIVLMVLYAALFVRLNVIQVAEQEDLNEHPENARPIQREFNRPRGTIVSADGALLAESVEVEGATFDRQRVYPEGELFGHVTGYFSFLYGASGVEQQYNDELTGNTLEQQLEGLSDLLADEQNTGNLRLTVRKDVQTVARDQLGQRQGSVVAIDPRTGALLALWSWPAFDPNLLATVDAAAATEAWDFYEQFPGKPLQAKAYQERYFPGSTFKTVTAGAGLRSGKVSATEPDYPVTNSYLPPQTTQPISNFGGSSCGGDLFEIMPVSCNSAFAEMGTETVGPDDMIDGAESFGFNAEVPIDLPDPAESAFPTDFEDNLPKLAQASIGQNDVQATPLQMALVAAAAGNDGEIMKPHVLDEVRDNEGNLVERYDPRRWKEPLSAGDAATLREAMIRTAEDGTATGLLIPGFEVGGKTGTAQLGTDPPRSHTWIIGFAGPPGGEATVAVAVVVLDQPASSDFTGGKIAAPIAKAVMEQALTGSGADAGSDESPTEGPGQDEGALAPGDDPSLGADSGAVGRHDLPVSVEGYVGTGTYRLQGALRAAPQARSRRHVRRLPRPRPRARPPGRGQGAVPGVRQGRVLRGALPA